MGFMVAAVALAAFLIGLSVLVLLMVLLASIRAEERCMSLTSAPPTRAGAASRRMLGVYVRRPHPASRCCYQNQGR